jgi:alpha-beta hydrolase superfamily lysophospholipase
MPEKRETEMNKMKLIAVVAVATTLAALGVARAEEATKSGYVEANGVNYFYSIYGEGEPLLLLHGGLGSIDMFAPILPILTEGRQVIGVDLQGHGRTALGDRPISLIDMGDDMAAILKALGYDQVDAPAGTCRCRRRRA